MKYRWPLTPLGEILTERREVPSSEDIESGRIRIIEKISFDSGRIHLRLDGSTKTGMILVRPGDLLVSGINAAKGAIAIYDESAHEPIAATIHYGAYIPKSDRVNVQFLWRMLRSRFFQDLLLEFVPGGIKTELKAKRFLPVPVPLPPLAEQRRIVARIEKLAAQINEARTLRQQAIEEAEAFRSAARRKLFYAIVRRFGASRLENLTTRITKGESPEWQGFSYQDSGPLFIRSENVLWGSLSLCNAVHIPHAFHQKLQRSQLRASDVLINLVGASIGRTCSVPKNIGEANVNQAVAVISPLEDKLIPEYLVQFILSPVAQDKIHGGKVETARPNISLGDLRVLDIPIPPLPEQRRIVAELDALQTEVDSLKRLQAETADELDALLPSILDRAFKGEI